MYVPQAQLERLKQLTNTGKVIIVYGPRRVGKTTLLKKFLENAQDVLFVSGEDIFVQDYLSSRSIDRLKNFIGTKKLLAIDEAQYIPSIGINLKLIVDHIPHVQVIATGSSTFDLSKEIGEPLTGRKQTLVMYPLAQLELNQIENAAQTAANLETRLIYGAYPEAVMAASNIDKQNYLHDLISSYLLKDILALEGIHKSKKLLDLLTLIAFQIGKEVSHTELAGQLSLNKATVEKYLDLLEKVFVLINLRGFSRNLRKEVTKTSRYYFYDNGIRNAIINNFNPINRRDDIGALWENYLVIERLKKQQYHQIFSKNYFWRTYDQKEIDLVEEREGALFAYEFKWGKAIAHAPKQWLEAYPDGVFSCINQENYLQFIC